jgi:hypothetical protein
MPYDDNFLMQEDIQEIERTGYKNVGKNGQMKHVKKQMHTRLCNIAYEALEIAKNYECPETCGFCCKCNTISHISTPLLDKT